MPNRAFCSEGVQVATELHYNASRFLSRHCRWEQETNTSSLSFRVDLVGYCALAPLVANPCEFRRKTTSLETPVFKPTTNFTKGNTWPKCGLKYAVPASRKQYVCTDENGDNPTQLGAVTAQSFLENALRNDRKNRIFIIGDSLAGQKFDLATCLFDQHKFSNIRRVEYKVTSVVGHGKGIEGIRSMQVYVNGRNNLVSLVLLSGPKWEVWETLLNYTGPIGLDDVVVMNFGLHYAITDNVAARHNILPSYIADMKAMIRHFDTRPATHKIWSMTTAVHIHNLPKGVDKNKFHGDSNVYVTHVNAAARALLQHRADWGLIDAYQTTITREDGLFPKDVRHYGSEVVEALLGEILYAVSTLLFH